MLLPLVQTIAPLGTMAASFSPERLSGNRVWLKADAIAGLADGDAVTTWPDSSGSGNDAASTGASRPTYRAGVLGARPVVRFAGGQFLQTAAFAAPLPQPTTILIVASATAGAVVQTYYDGLTADSRQALYKGVGASLYQWSTAAQLTVSDSYSFGTMDVLASQYDGANSRTWRNGVLLASGAAGTADLDGLNVGNNYLASAPLSGDIAELLVYVSALSDADRGAVEAYLFSKYAVTPG